MTRAFTRIRGIELAVDQIDDEIDQHEQKHHENQIGDHHRAVEHGDRIDDELAHAGPVEHRLGHDREGERRTELEAEDGDDRDRDILQHVQAHDLAFGEALRAGETHIVRAHDFHSAGAREADQKSELEQREIEGRQDDVTQPLHRADGQLHAEEIV